MQYFKTRVEFIYFDVGGVLVLDFSKTNKWNQMLDDLNIPVEKREQFERLFDEFEVQICNGRNINDFIAAAQKQLEIRFPQNYDMTSDFVNRFEPNLALGKIIKKLSDKYRLGLLTNMYPRMLDLITQEGLLPNAEWNAVVDSSVIKLSKPQLEIFKFAEAQAGVEANKILFVDNSKSHIEAATSLGWQTLLYDPKNLEESNQELERITKV